MIDQYYFSFVFEITMSNKINEQSYDKLIKPMISDSFLEF
jgi:hypothetical protein